MRVGVRAWENGDNLDPYAIDAKRACAMHRELSLVRPRKALAAMTLLRSGLSVAALVLAAALLIPAASPAAKEDCSALDIALGPLPEFKTVECDAGSFRHGEVSHMAEVISASGSASVYVIHHLESGVRTYFNRLDTRRLLDDLGEFATIDKWGAGPGGDGFMVARFKGTLEDAKNFPLSCFGFSRFSGHVASTSGYRHIVYGFYCSAQPDDVAGADIRRLIGALTFDFE